MSECASLTIFPKPKYNFDKIMLPMESRTVTLNTNLYELITSSRWMAQFLSLQFTDAIEFRSHVSHYLLYLGSLIEVLQAPIINPENTLGETLITTNNTVFSTLFSYLSHGVVYCWMVEYTTESSPETLDTYLHSLLTKSTITFKNCLHTHQVLLRWLLNINRLDVQFYRELIASNITSLRDFVGLIHTGVNQVGASQVLVDLNIEISNIDHIVTNGKEYLSTMNTVHILAFILAFPHLLSANLGLDAPIVPDLVGEMTKLSVECHKGVVMHIIAIHCQALLHSDDDWGGNATTLHFKNFLKVQNYDSKSTTGITAVWDALLGDLNALIENLCDCTRYSQPPISRIGMANGYSITCTDAILKFVGTLVDSELCHSALKVTTSTCFPLDFVNSLLCIFHHLGLFTGIHLEELGGNSIEKNGLIHLVRLLFEFIIVHYYSDKQTTDGKYSSISKYHKIFPYSSETQSESNQLSTTTTMVSLSNTYKHKNGIPAFSYKRAALISNRSKGTTPGASINGQCRKSIPCPSIASLSSSTHCVRHLLQSTRHSHDELPRTPLLKLTRESNVDPEPNKGPCCNESANHDTSPDSVQSTHSPGHSTRNGESKGNSANGKLYGSNVNSQPEMPPIVPETNSMHEVNEEFNNTCKIDQSGSMLGDMHKSTEMSQSGPAYPDSQEINVLDIKYAQSSNYDKDGSGSVCSESSTSQPVGICANSPIPVSQHIHLDPSGSPVLDNSLVNIEMLSDKANSEQLQHTMNQSMLSMYEETLYSTASKQKLSEENKILRSMISKQQSELDDLRRLVEQHIAKSKASPDDSIIPASTKPVPKEHTSDIPVDKRDSIAFHISVDELKTKSNFTKSKLATRNNRLHVVNTPNIDVNPGNKSTLAIANGNTTGPSTLLMPECGKVSISRSKPTSKSAARDSNKSNTASIVNAIRYTCYPGDINADRRSELYHHIHGALCSIVPVGPTCTHDQISELIKVSSTLGRVVHLVILFKDEYTAAVKGLYINYSKLYGNTNSVGECIHPVTLARVWGCSPTRLTIQNCEKVLLYRYDNGGKRFIGLASKQFDSHIDAIAFHSGKIPR